MRTSLKSHLPAEENVRTPFLPLRNFYNMIERMKTMAAGTNMYADPHLTTTTKKLMIPDDSVTSPDAHGYSIPANHFRLPKQIFFENIRTLLMISITHPR